MKSFGYEICYDTNIKFTFMRSITLHEILHPVSYTRRFSLKKAMKKLIGYKFMDVADTTEYKYNPEQYCIDRGIIQHPSSFQMKGRSRLRIKDK